MLKNQAYSDTLLERSTSLFKALADPVRLRLVSLLSDGREVCVCHLHEALELPQPTVSRHLAYLRKHRLVIGRKQGLWVRYCLAKPQDVWHQRVLESVTTGLAHRDVFEQDRRRLERITGCCRIL